MENIWSKSTIVGFDGPNFTGKSTFIKYVKESIESYVSKNNIDLKVEIVKPTLTDEKILTELNLIGPGKYINGDVGKIIEIASHYANCYKSTIGEMRLKEIKNTSSEKPHYSLYILDRTPLATYVYSLANLIVGNPETISPRYYLENTDTYALQLHNLLMESIISMYHNGTTSDGVFLDKLFIMQSNVDNISKYKELSKEGRDKGYDGIVYEDDRFIRVLGDLYNYILSNINGDYYKYGFNLNGSEEVIDTASKTPKDIISTIVLSIMSSVKNIMDFNKETLTDISTNVTEQEEADEAEEVEENTVEEERSDVEEEEEREVQSESLPEGYSGPLITGPSIYLITTKLDYDGNPIPGETEEIKLDKPSTHIKNQPSTAPVMMEIREKTDETSNTIKVSRIISSSLREDIPLVPKLIEENGRVVDDWWTFKLRPIQDDGAPGLETFILKYEKSGKPVTKQITIKYMEA